MKSVRKHNGILYLNETYWNSHENEMSRTMIYLLTPNFVNRTSEKWFIVIIFTFDAKRVDNKQTDVPLLN